MTLYASDVISHKITGKPQLFATAQALPELESALKNGPHEVILDFETTGATPWLQGGKLTGKIGEKWTVDQYCKEHDCTADFRLRPRVLSVGVPSGGFHAAFDLDLMDEAAQRRLIQLLSEHYWVVTTCNLITRGPCLFVRAFGLQKSLIPCSWLSAFDQNYLMKCRQRPLKWVGIVRLSCGSMW